MPDLDVAKVLHTKLLDPQGPPELGLRYLEAVRQDPRVSLYNFYGLAAEPAW